MIQSSNEFSFAHWRKEMSRINAINAIVDDNTREFAVACYSTNSTEELKWALGDGYADRTDMEGWGLTAAQWREAIAAALADKVADAE